MIMHAKIKSGVVFGPFAIYSRWQNAAIGTLLYNDASRSSPRDNMMETVSAEAPNG